MAAPAQTLFDHRGIKKLFVNRLRTRGDLQALAILTSLRVLSLANPRLAGLDGIQSLSGLEFFEIGRSRMLSNLAGLEALSNLTWLELSTCRKLDDISPVGELSELRALRLGDLARSTLSSRCRGSGSWRSSFS